MASTLKEYDSIDIDIQSQIREWILSNTSEFSDSLLYLPAEEEKIIDKGRRVSQFRTFTDTVIFTLVESLIAKLNAVDTETEFYLVKNDVTHIRYEKDGFFKKHQDYLSLSTNTVTEYTMLMCLDADCEGGETLFHINPHFSHASKCSVQKDGIVVFRKDIYHEGSVLKSGRKDIMSLNLWGIQKNTGKYVVINTSDDKAIILSGSSVARFDNYFTAALHFGETKESKTIATIDVDNTAEEMDIVRKVLEGHHITMDDYKEHKQVLDYYLIPGQEIIASLTSQMKESSVTEKISALTFVDKPYTLYHSKEEQLYWNDIAAEVSERMIPFEITFVEGQCYYVGIGNVKPIRHAFDPYYFTVDDVLIWYKSIITTDKAHHDVNGAFTQSVINCIMDSAGDYEEIGDPLYQHLDARHSGTKQATTCPCLMRKYSVAYEALDASDAPDASTLDNLHEDNLYEEGDEIKATLQEAIRYHDVDCPLFEILRISKLIPIDDIKYDIITGGHKVEFPQEETSVEHGYCNENLYGNMTLVTVYGLFKTPQDA